jgi:hypothetical protein
MPLLPDRFRQNSDIHKNMYINRDLYDSCIGEKRAKCQYGQGVSGLPGKPVNVGIFWVN